MLAQFTKVGLHTWKYGELGTLSHKTPEIMASWDSCKEVNEF